MTNDVVVFLGPTMTLADARDRLDACFLPPVSQGDIISVIRDRPRAIGIIDGYFQLVPAVWHKEILHALEAGIPVLGAGSMGALRAAELDAFGMRGVGRIYRWYRSGFIDADDEVAVIHSPHSIGHKPLSEAMVNIRATLDLAVRKGDLSVQSALILLDACAETPYWQRSYDRLAQDARQLGLSAAEVDAVIAAERVDQKRLDAAEMLDLLASGDFTNSVPPEFHCNRTTKFERLADRDTCLARNGDGRMTTGALIDYYLLEGYRLGAGSASLKAARNQSPTAEVIAAMQDEGRYDTVLKEAIARDCSDGLRPSEGDDSAAVSGYCHRARIDPHRPLGDLARDVGIDDPDRFLERLHRFGFARPTCAS